MQMIELTSSIKSVDEIKFIINVNGIRYVGKDNLEDEKYSGTNAVIKYHSETSMMTFYVKETYEELKSLLCK